MKYFNFYFLFVFILFDFKFCYTQINPANYYPEIFKAVQTQEIFPDQKTFVDFRPLFHPDTIINRYNKQKNLPAFDLKTFIGQHFDTILLDTSAIFNHIEHLWKYLSREPRQQDSLSSLIALPHIYIVPGGRFREIYYWDSYFTMLGLEISGKTVIIENMIDNFAFLIDTYAHIPNGNRTYYLSRSQPPFFSLMVDLLANIKGDSIYQKYLPQLEKEYQYWMDGKENLDMKNSATQKVVLLEKNSVLNRYCDKLNTPRPESYLQDVTIKEVSNRSEQIYQDIRSAAESGWDFSARWFRDASTIETIHTTEIIPVDLNCLLYHLERTLQKAYYLANKPTRESGFKKAADVRKELIMKYFWNPDSGYFYDFNFVTGEQTLRGSLAGVFPLYFNIPDKRKAEKVISVIQNQYLNDGGLVTSNFRSGQQWDFPNGWAPLQWIGYVACKNYNADELAHNIAMSWTSLNMKVFFETGKMLEKYNVVNTNLPGGGGEYKLQDGFGWTNGVFLKLWNAERTKK